uniref:Photosynthesis system II assembly factor Ycf48/Hcf136-like domain-containing protein n=1 Tax=candidate division WOR-3 bacterium TaxID=2052148 RepID=A0A7V3ZVG4_UNCW3
MKKLLIFLVFSFIFADWTIQNSSVSVTLYSLSFPTDTMLGYACGENGTIIKTTNSGQNWSRLSVSLSENLYSIFFVNETIGYACGRNGKVIKTTNGGENWQNLVTEITENLYQLHFISPDTGFIAGDNGMVLRTYDGGQTFDYLSVSPINPFDLRGISVVANGRIVYAVGLSGSIFKTTDYGNNWVQLNSQTRANLFKVIFLNPNIGYVCSESGYVLKTTDGNNFTRLNVASPQPLYGIHFISSQVGYVCGGNGLVYKTTNGGENWEREYTGVGENLYYIFFKTEDIGWACGRNGLIIKRYLPSAITENKNEKTILKIKNNNLFLSTGQIIRNNNKLNKGIYFIKNNKKFKKIIKLN